jgi:predicted metal-binding protein
VDDRNKHQLFVCTKANNVHLENYQTSTVPGLVLSDIAAHVKSYHSSEAVQDVGYLKEKLLDISRETL